MIVEKEAEEQKEEKRAILDLLGNVVGSALAVAGKVVLPEESERAACEMSGFIDDEYKKTKGGGGLFNTAGAAIGQGFMTVMKGILPQKANRQACITAGFYTPEKHEGPELPDSLPPIYVQDPPNYVNSGGSQYQPQYQTNGGFQPQYQTGFIPPPTYISGGQPYFGPGEYTPPNKPW